MVRAIQRGVKDCVAGVGKPKPLQVEKAQPKRPLVLPVGHRPCYHSHLWFPSDSAC